MYPIKFQNLYYKKIWGGRDLGSFRNNLPEGKIGESWDIACHKNGTGTVANGEFKGIKFDELIDKLGKKLLGTEIKKERFPLLIKLINATDNLSIQVHPNDVYANKIENDSGKSEVWYVVDAFEGASLIVGTKAGCDIHQFKKAIEQGNLEKFVNKVPVKKGDVYFIKSGLVHAICKGVIIAEIQQSSDVTYRVYDYGRGRELHVQKALDVVDLSLRGEKSRGITLKREGFEKTYLCLAREFSLELYDIRDKASETSDEERFYIFTCVDGQGQIMYDNGAESIFKGDSFLIPAFLGEYTLKGNMKLLKSYVPDCSKVENNILKEIRKF
ncbi:type I phosphomannose isomerase catalytic subunit [Clostridium luticellarii]|uniref:Phosphohexomutase n=1 Tax=Clostridium luticellarii TaxID=1691940 RepID=A0A2T0BSG1_9CLOT|nr:type I phosphomannose isomerase catalytic subunit [Clostridium luticellarii]MCI1996382.1 class I mannose-6-phosphate isomerase [Clostridium luticellarii]PRR86807.1 putative mannose-6-phosphate isomerase YvyI [Clostridium luticellarii]